MNRVLSLFFIFITAFSSFSQTKEDALNDAKKAAKATMNGDYKEVLNHTFPEVIKGMGGEEKALKLITTMFSNLKTQGFVFESAEVISVSDIVIEQGKHRCYVKGKNQIRVSDNRIVSTSYLLGQYDKKNKKWLFLEAEKLSDSALVQSLFPGFKTSLKIPKDKTKMEKID